MFHLLFILFVLVNTACSKYFLNTLYFEKGNISFVVHFFLRKYSFSLNTCGEKKLSFRSKLSFHL